MIISSSQAGGFDKPKRERYMKTPPQLEALETLFSGTNYPTAAEMEELARRLELSDTQVRMWFCHRRRKKYEMERSRKKSLKVSVGNKRMISYSSDDGSESDSESDADSGRVSPREYYAATALTEHRERSGNSPDGRLLERSKLRKIKSEHSPPEEAHECLHSQSLIKSACTESDFSAHSQRVSEEIETSKKSLCNLEAELDDMQKKVHSAKKEVKGLKSWLGKDDVISAWRSEVTALKAELAAAKVEKDSAAKLFDEKLEAKNQELEDLNRQLATERARLKEEKDEAYARFGNDVVALIGKFKAAP